MAKPVAKKAPPAPPAKKTAKAPVPAKKVAVKPAETVEEDEEEEEAPAATTKKAAPAKPAAKKAPPAPAKKTAKAPEPEEDEDEEEEEEEEEVEEEDEDSDDAEDEDEEEEEVEDSDEDDAEDEDSDEEEDEPAMSIAEEMLALAQKCDPKFSGPTHRESEQEYYLRLLTTTSAPADEDWESLSDPASDWYNDAAKAMNEKKVLPALPGYTHPTKPDRGAALREFNAQRKAAKERGETLPKSAKPKKEKVAKEKKARGGGIVDTIQREIARNPNVSIEQLTKAVEKAGLTSSPITITATRGAALNLIRHAREAGTWRDPK